MRKFHIKVPYKKFMDMNVDIAFTEKSLLRAHIKFVHETFQFQLSIITYWVLDS